MTHRASMSTIALGLLLLTQMTEDAWPARIVVPPRPIDRPFPIGFCPLPFEVEFPSPGTSVTIRIWANTRTANGDIVVQGIDNISLTTVEDYGRNSGTGCPRCQECFTGSSPTRSFYPNASLSAPLQELFSRDPTGSGWDMTQGAVWDVTSSAPTDPRTGAIAQNGFLRFAGTACDDDTARTSIVVQGLGYSYPHNNPRYVLSGWWYARPMVSGQTTLVIQIDTYPQGSQAPGSQWPILPQVNLPIATDDANEMRPISVSDGTGGIILFWDDSRASDALADAHVYGQRLDRYGRRQWQVGDLSVSDADVGQYVQAVEADGMGGAIVLFGQASELRAQRVSAAGERLWGDDGLPVAASAGSPVLLADGAGGAFMVWNDNRNSATLGMDIYGQHLDAAGSPLWGSGGVACVSLPSIQAGAAIVPDGAGGILCAWTDHRNASATGPDIYAQRLSSAGVKAWSDTGVVVCRAPGPQYLSRGVRDDAGSAVFGWEDSRRASFADLYAQRVRPDGTLAWSSSGVPICVSGNPGEAHVVGDGAGGTIWAWRDRRTGEDGIYAQRVTASGSSRWVTNGVTVCSEIGNRFGVGLVPDGASGGIVTWADARAQLPQGGDDYNQYAQRVDSAGALRWLSGGQPVCTAYDNQIGHTESPDSAGGVIVVWSDTRRGNELDPGNYPTDLFGQRVDRAGRLGTPEPQLASFQDVPGDEGGHLVVRWRPSSLDRTIGNRINEYRVFERNGTGAPIQVGQIAASQQCLYELTVPTSQDAIAGEPRPQLEYWVEARSSDGAEVWLSEPDSGLSLDNLAPASLDSARAAIGARTARVTWSASTALDLSHYVVYRSQDAVPPLDSLAMVAASVQTLSYLDSQRDPTVPHYLVAAVDIHGNAGPRSLATETVGADPASALLAPLPNPSRDFVTMAFRAEGTASASIRIYDLRGALVRGVELGDTQRASGTWVWDGRDDDGRAVDAGVYFCGLEIGTNRVWQKLVRVR